MSLPRTLSRAVNFCYLEFGAIFPAGYVELSGSISEQFGIEGNRLPIKGATLIFYLQDYFLLKTDEINLATRSDKWAPPFWSKSKFSKLFAFSTKINILFKISDQDPSLWITYGNLWRPGFFCIPLSYWEEPTAGIFYYSDENFLYLIIVFFAYEKLIFVCFKLIIPNFTI